MRDGRVENRTGGGVCRRYGSVSSQGVADQELVCIPRLHDGQDVFRLYAGVVCERDEFSRRGGEASSPPHPALVNRSSSRRKAVNRDRVVFPSIWFPLDMN